jgi:hypothetical protein
MGDSTLQWAKTRHKAEDHQMDKVELFRDSLAAVSQAELLTPEFIGRDRILFEIQIKL